MDNNDMDMDTPMTHQEGHCDCGDSCMCGEDCVCKTGDCNCQEAAEACCKEGGCVCHVAM